MAAIAYHPGLQSHLESQLVESRTLRLMLPSPKQVTTPQSIDLAFKSRFLDSNMIKTHHHEENINKTETFQNKPINIPSNTWNFLDTLSQNTPKKETITTYVHPQQKRSSLVLSPKSLELCTENLGSESCTDIVENDMLLSSMGTTMEQRQPCRQVLAATKKTTKSQNFPPPLTTIRGSESLRVRPHREDGRLVIEMTKVPPSTSCFQADRSHGRLRLCFLTNHTTSFDQEEEQEEENYDVINENEQKNNEGLEEECYENEIIVEKIKDVEQEETEDKTEDKTEEETGEETEDEEVEGGGGVGSGCECEKMKGSDVRIEKYEIPRRCKESGEHENNELLNWSETLWVATTS